MKMYVLIRIATTGMNGEITLDPVGVYDDLSIASTWAKKLEKINTSPHDSVFDIIDFGLNEAPLVLEDMQTLYNELLEERSKALKTLMDKEWVDQLIGEDGNFYYRITEKGKKTVKQAPRVETLIKKLLNSMK